MNVEQVTEETPAPEPVVEEVPEPEPVVEEEKSLTQTILSAISEEEDEKPPIPIDETPDFADIVKPSRGPPGGGRLVREGAPKKPASGPPTRGPPAIESETPSEEKDIPTLTPVLRPVLQPASRKVLTPVEDVDDEESEQAEVSVLKPVTRAVLKPIGPSTSEEEE